MPISVNASVNAIRSAELLGMGWADARKAVGSGNFVRRVNAAVAAGRVRSYRYICIGRPSVGLRPSASFVGIVPVAVIFIRVSSTIVPGIPVTS